MTMPSTDPFTLAWLFALSALFIVLIAVPILRAALAGVLYAVGALTGNDRIRHRAAHVMPRIGHLIGSIVIGTAAVAAPALAVTDAPRDVMHIDLDRDAGGNSDHAVRQDAPQQPALQQHSPSAQHSSHSPSAASTSHRATIEERGVTEQPKVYIVHSGDTLWDIAAEQLSEPTSAEITARWKAIWQANRAVIGDDPGLIHPGQALAMGSLV